MKKIIFVLVALFAVLGLSSCGNDSVEIALITDTGKIDDHSFNEGAWTGVEKYAEENDITRAYYKPAGTSDNDREDMMNQAIDKGAKVVVLPGYLFEFPVGTIAKENPNVDFILLDGSPKEDDGSEFGKIITLDNVVSLDYAEEQSGYLAGYASVQEGFTELGFVGGMAVPAVVRFGRGYVQGAEQAAKDMELEANSITMNYWYSGGFAPTDAIKAKADTWGNAGTEVVFSCGGGIWSSVAASTVPMLIGVDTDQAKLDDKFITSAMKELASSVYDQLKGLYDNDGTLPAAASGKHLHLDIAGDYVGLATGDSWKLTTYTEAMYNTFYAKVKAGVADGSIVISSSIEEADFPTTSYVTVNRQN